MQTLFRSSLLDGGCELVGVHEPDAVLEDREDADRSARATLHLRITCRSKALAIDQPCAARALCRRLFDLDAAPLAKHRSARADAQACLCADLTGQQFAFTRLYLGLEAATLAKDRPLRRESAV